MHSCFCNLGAQRCEPPEAQVSRGSGYSLLLFFLLSDMHISIELLTLISRRRMVSIERMLMRKAAAGPTLHDAKDTLQDSEFIITW